MFGCGTKLQGMRNQIAENDLVSGESKVCCGF
jgi:hypothetical protein